MIFTWLQRRRRKKLLAREFPAEWLGYLERNVPHYRWLDRTKQARLRDDLRIFVAEKHWEGCGGLALTDEIKVTIAALACLMLLGLSIDAFHRVLSILVYPKGYSAPVERQHGGIILQSRDTRLGEAWYLGPVILSWEDLLWDAQRPGQGQNLVWHEFAHQLDMLDRSTDGTPPLASRELYRRWTEVMTAEFQRLRAAIRAGGETLLDPYGAKDEAEFFAVVTECFFDAPHAMLAQHPSLYELLREYYRQDPAKRVPQVDE